MYNKILLCSKNPKFKEEITSLVGDVGYDFRQVQTGTEIYNIESTFKPAVVVIEATENKTELFQAYDAAYRTFSNARIVVVYDNQLAFDMDQIGGRKQGMKLLQRPFEDELLLNYFLEYAPIEIPAKNLKLEHLTAISLSDIRASDKFNFDLYLYMPMNNKVLLYRRKNSVLTPAQIEGFNKYHVHDLYVRKNEMGTVTDYLAKKITKTFGDQTLSVTERRRKLQNEVRAVFGKFFDSSQFDYAKSRVTLDTCKQVVGKFITEINPKSDIYNQLLHYTAQGSTQYNHAVNVSVFSVLFALALEVKEIEPISIGALLHDIGLATLPKYLANKDFEKMSPEEKTVYKTHPSAGLKLLDGKKVLASEEVKAVITQHHENMDGTGYPAGLKKEQIHICARIVQIANALDRLTCVRPGHTAPLTPSTAIDHMIMDNAGGEKFDQELLTKIKALLCPPNEKLINLSEVKESFSKPITMPPNPDAVDVNDTTRKRRRQKLGS